MDISGYVYVFVVPCILASLKALLCVHLTEYISVLKMFSFELMAANIAAMILALLNFVPLLYFDVVSIDFSTTTLPVSLECKSLHIVSGFCLGFTSLLLIDIAVDDYWHNLERILSRVCYILTFLGLSICAIIEGDYKVLVYITFFSFGTVVFVGQALIDLCHFDATRTWTLSKAIATLTLLSISFILTMWYECNPTDISMQSAGLALRIIAIVAIVVNCGICIVANIKANRLLSFWKLPHAEFKTLLTSTVLSVFIILLAAVGGSLTGFKEYYHFNPTYICFDLLVRQLFISCLVLIPSLMLKKRAYDLQVDLEVKRGFVRYVSHEIRTPLNIDCTGLRLIHDTVERMEACTEATKEALDLLEDCQSSTDDAVAILSNLLTYEKLDVHMMALEKAPTRLAPFIREKLRPFQVQARSSGIELSLLPYDEASDPSESLDNVYVDIDRAKIAQVLRNFLSNALKFTRAGGSVWVRLELLLVNPAVNATRPNQSIVPLLPRNVVRISVIDSGAGIAIENLDKVWGEMMQIDASTQQSGGGTGMGLWITKKIVEMHGGTVGFTSEGKGLGCTFYCDLPISKFETAGTIRGSINNAGLPVFSSTADTARLHVMIVDDSAMNRKMMGKLLSSLGYTFKEADDGETAVELMKKSLSTGEVFDCILMDNHMPRMNGRDAVRMIRYLGFKGRIVGVTGDAMDEDIEKFIESGVNVVLSKPLRPEEFHAEVILKLQSKDGEGGRMALIRSPSHSANET